MTEKMDELWSTLVEMGIATDEELGLAIALCGRTIQTLESVLYIRTGYRNIDQMLDEYIETLPDDFVDDAKPSTPGQTHKIFEKKY